SLTTLSICPSSIVAAGTPGRGAASLNAVLVPGSIRRILLGFLIALAALFPAAAQAGVYASLARQMRIAGPYSGAYVVDSTTGAQLFSWKASTSRILASNTKLFTTSAALDRFGADATLPTEVLTDVPPNDEGVVGGDLWLRGGGDPAFGSSTYVRRNSGPGEPSVQDLADQLLNAGVTAVRGGVHGDESLFDTIRGVHDSRYGVSPWVGPLSALSF